MYRRKEPLSERRKEIFHGLRVLVGLWLIGLFLQPLAVSFIGLLPLGVGYAVLFYTGFSSLLTMLVPALLYGRFAKLHYNAPLATTLGLQKPTFCNRQQGYSTTRSISLALGELVITTGVAILLVQGVETFTTFLVGCSPEKWQTWVEAQRLQETKSLEQLTAIPTHWGRLVTLLVGAILPAVGEELFFRGALQPLLIKATASNWLGIALTALLFALLHLSVIHFLAIFTYALLFGYVAHRTKSVYPSMLLHFLNNCITLLFYL